MRRNLMIPLLGGGRRLTELGACIPPHEAAVRASVASAATRMNHRSRVRPRVT